MSLSKYTPKEGWLFISIKRASKEQLDKYYSANGEIKASGQSENAPRECKIAVIESTYSEEQYPIDSEWMMGEAPGISLNFFGEKIIMVQERDLYARIN